MNNKLFLLPLFSGMILISCFKKEIKFSSSADQKIFDKKDIQNHDSVKIFNKHFETSIQDIKYLSGNRLNGFNWEDEYIRFETRHTIELKDMADYQSFDPKVVITTFREKFRKDETNLSNSDELKGLLNGEKWLVFNDKTKTYFFRAVKNW